MTRSVLAIPCLVLTLAAGLAVAQGVPSGTRRSPEMLQAFRPVVASAVRSTARVQGDGVDVALATVVSPEGLLITKFSELKGKLVCQLADGRRMDAAVIGVEPKYDLALLKVAATGLTAATFENSTKAEAGDWLASAGTGSEPIAVGVVGVPTRKPRARDFPANPPPAGSGYMGVYLKDGDGPATIGSLEKKGPAEKAGLKVDDVILSVAGRKIANAEKLIEAVQKYKAGQKVTLKVKRGGPNGDMEELEMELGKRSSAGGFDRGDFQNKMGSALSVKRQGFPVIFQHDMVIKPTDCGGPVVNLDGKVIGVNIARAGRTESYAIPAEAVQNLLVDLRSGKLAPQPDESELETTLGKINDEVRILENRIDRARLTDDQDALKKNEASLKVAKKRQDELKAALEKLRSKE